MKVADHRPTLVNVVHSLNPGGAERLVVDMSIMFSDDYRVFVLCLDHVGAWANILRRKKIPVYQIRRQPGVDVYLAFRMAKQFKKIGADVIHAHQTAPWFYSALSRIFFSRPRLLFEEHGRHYPETDSHMRRLVNRMLISPLTHVNVAVSEETRERLVRYEGLRRDTVDVIYNGAHRDIPPRADEISAARRSLGFTRDHIVIGFVGRLDPVKNVSLLIRGVRSIADSYPNLRCLIIGDGKDMRRLRDEIESSGLAAKVVLAGYRSDAQDLMHCMDIFVLPSYSEGTSMSLLEAMAADVPTIVTNVGGNVELVENGVSGYVIKSGSVTELSEAIENIIANPGQSARFAKAGKERFERQFSFDSMVSKYRQLYLELRPRSA